MFKPANKMKQQIKTIVLFLMLLGMFGCKEHVDTSARYVFTDKTAFGYLSTHDVYSEYTALLTKVNISVISGMNSRYLCISLVTTLYLWPHSQ